MSEMTFAEAYRAVQPAVNQYKGWLHIAEALNKAAMAEDAAKAYSAQAADAQRARDDAKFQLNDLSAAVEAARAGLDKALVEVREQAEAERTNLRDALRTEEREAQAQLVNLRRLVAEAAEAFEKQQADHEAKLLSMEQARAAAQKVLDDVEAARQALRARL